MKFIELDVTDSTNSFAKREIAKFPDRTIICAKRQTNGRGRFTRRWVDLGEGNLFMSMILKPSDKFQDVYSNLTQYLAVVLCRVLETYGLKPQIKWPNDVLIDGRKIAGILSETVMQGNNFKGLVLGIGVNLNASPEKLAQIPDKIATALNIETGKEINAGKFREILVDEFFGNYDRFLAEGFSYIKDEYTKRNCFLNKELSVRVFNRIENGLAKEINDNGGLVLLNKDKNELVLTIGDIL